MGNLNLHYSDLQLAAHLKMTASAGNTTLPEIKYLVFERKRRDDHSKRTMRRPS
jgi:hypothetical protein